MKRCPECRRNYYDDSLTYCLDDGEQLLEGPASIEPATAILPGSSFSDDVQTRILGEAEASKSNSADRITNQIHSRRGYLLAGIVAVLVIALIGIGSLWLYGRRSQNRISSIAVMPFLNEGGNPDVEYLSDGMTETLISSLSQIPELSVRARSSVFRFKGTNTDLHQIAAELNVGAILSGKVSQHGQDLLLYAELVDMSSDRVVWSKSYSRSMTNLVTLQGEIASDVLQGLQTKLSGSEQEKVAKKYTANPDAYKLYLQGRYYWNKRTPQEIAKAIDYFEQAIALDPNYALAYSALADCYAVDSSPVKGEERDPKLLAAANKALAIDASLGEPHAALANVSWNAHDWAAAENEFKKAIELNPNYATARQWYGEMLTRLGRHNEAIEQITRARDLEPLSIVINSDMIYILSMARLYDESIAQAKKTLELDPNWTTARGELLAVYTFKGMYEESLSEEEFLVEHSDLVPEKKAVANQEIEAVREAYRRSGAIGYWTKRREQETKDPSRKGFSAFFMAEIYANLGEKDEAFKWLEKAIEQRDSSDLIKVYPGFDALRDDPRFGQMLERAGLPE